jgi:hypothetical protein
MTDPTPPLCAGEDRVRFRRAVLAHFSGRIDVGEEHHLRTHLSGCPVCRRFYSRALALSGADPRAPRARDRLARGLGLRLPDAQRARSIAVARRWGWAAPVLAGVAVLAIRLAAPASRAPAPVPVPPAARGVASASAPALLAYRIPPHGVPTAVNEMIGGHDELAFAYSNPGAWPYLMIFAVDEHQHVYWYHPSWRVHDPPPAAIPARAGIGPFELPSATRHGFDGRRLVVYAVFGRQSLGVDEVERAARTARGPDLLSLPDGAQIVRRAIEVAP